jgi:hypothetical protein
MPKKKFVALSLSFLIAWATAQSIWAQQQLIIPTVIRAVDSQALDLAGPWRFAMDRGDAGVKEQWLDCDLLYRHELRRTAGLYDLGAGG